jgi:deoxyribose-phosphate aldolase
MTREEFCKMMDHSLLRPYCTKAQVRQWCEEYMKYGFAVVAVNPCEVAYARSIIGDRYGLETVIGYPQGVNTTRVKILEGLDAIDNGADELDVVMNISRFKEGDYAYVQNELNEFVAAMREKRPGIVIKVIWECNYMEDWEVPIVCDIIYKSGADYIKEATGYTPVSQAPVDKGGLECVRKVRAAIGNKCGIKSGGKCYSLDDMIECIKAGASRMGEIDAPRWLDAAGDDYWKDK